MNRPHWMHLSTGHSRGSPVAYDQHKGHECHTEDEPDDDGYVYSSLHNASQHVGWVPEMTTSRHPSGLSGQTSCIRVPARHLL